MSAKPKTAQTIQRQRKGRASGASLGDVARQAGVSTATVSRVLNTPDKVAHKNRLAVLAAVDALGYIPDGAARALASRQSRAIGAVVPTLDNALFAAGIQGFQRRLKSLGYSVIIASHEYDLDEEFSEVRTLLRQGVDALLLVGSIHDPGLADLLRSKGLPHVNCWAYRPDSAEPCVGFDNRQAARQLTEYLLDLGHRDIAVIAGRTRHNDRAADRLLGVTDAIEGRGMRLDADRVQERSYSLKQGREAMRALLQRSRPPTAVVCGNDILALGALAECQAQQVRIPAEMSITGFDDLDISAQIVPPLTTVHVPLARMGELAAEYLVAQIEGENPPTHTEIETELVVRGTTAAPRRTKIAFNGGAPSAD